MQFDSTGIVRGNAADTAQKQGGKARLLTLEDLDGRTKAAQYVREARSDVVADLGGEEALSTLERVAVDNVVLTAAMLRDAGVRWLQGEQIDANLVATLQNTFNRSAASLGWHRRAKDITPDLRTYARGGA